MPSIEYAGEAALLLRLDEAPSPQLTQRLLAIGNALHAACGDAVACAPAYQTLMVQFDAARITRTTVQQQLSAVQDLPAPAQPMGKLITLPVLYDPKLAPDLDWLAQHAGLSIPEVIARHTGTVYHAYANGFAPGFCYLGEVPAQLAAPRMATPRRAVPAGAVGIADRQTGIYPSVSPGGWRIIGLCPQRLFNPDLNPPNRVAVGDRVQFSAIDHREFQAMGGTL